MENLLSFLTSTEIIVVYVVALLAILLCFIVYLIDKNYDKRKQKQNTKELNKLVDAVQERLEQEEVPVVNNIETNEVTMADIPVMIEPIIDVVPSDKEEKTVVEVIPTPDKITTMSIEELQQDEQQEQVEQQQETVQQEVEQVGQVEEQVNEIPVQEIEELHYTDVELTQEQALNELVKLTERLEAEAQKEDSLLEERIKDYEDAQEKDAIISMDQLLERTREMATFTDYNEETAPISLAEIESKNTEVVESELTKTIDKVSENKAQIIEELETEELTDYVESKPLSEVYKESTVRFKSSPVISPIYGIETKQTVESMEFENTANYEKLDAEIKKTNEFLSKIRELQKKLGD